MFIRLGYTISFVCDRPTPMMLMLDVHASRRKDVVAELAHRTTPALALTHYFDDFGNRCTRVVAPAGETTFHSDLIVSDSGLPDAVRPELTGTPVEALPAEVLVYLLGSRYCETDRLVCKAWELFSHTPPGWARVQAICDFVHQHIQFGYEHADSKRGAWQGFEDRRGVCRDFAHLAVTLCRCMNIPARYCTGYLGDIGVPKSDAPMDFSAWFEVWLNGAWHTFDARHNTPRIGRVLLATGRDASDVAISNTFGPARLSRFEVWTDETENYAAPFLDAPPLALIA